MNWLESLARAWAEQSGWEMLAVVLALAYLILAVRQNAWCWAAALASTAIYTVLFWQVQLPMQSALNVYYMGMAVYGWWHWRHGGSADRALPVTRWPWRHHLIAVALIAVSTLISGFLLSRHADAAWPYLDSLVTWGAVVTTFMVARKLLENWAYWMVLNALAIVLFVERAMVLTAALYVAYLVLSVVGWASWLRAWRAQNETVSSQ
ncbi:nicotinamide riboside transporter PnuC [Wenzhouxiangella marina]|uniref:Nicotinamide riboside transporter PnuC n=1 Tax=Wenzhouxiangella marina TaxID=1579979 RepID=A0A0K0XUC8_9GAMM|nr:nicotinamide riboside transporter PnuC [Wenzhouxiangella marina]AKS41221.1 nicotinamide mononucleotide transporter [Wenzhouxiangella marina]MBB6088101.1 nicotinamide mononucleotide transporter [Wenzhouxiangella marina]